VVYPGILKRCDNCHVPNAVNFGASGATLLPNLLWSTSATGMYSSTDTAKVYARDPVTGLLKYIVADATDAGNTANGKYVTGGTNYGTVFSFTPEGSAVPRIVPFASAGTNILSPVFGTNQVVAPSGGTIIPADGHNLVESPVSSACFACHDTSTARSHMTQYGGVIYGVRSTYLPFTNGVRADANNETCLICHGMGRDQDAAVVHAK
jgi:OmcA/MtrC family decaheme c-type cytochrome